MITVIITVHPPLLKHLQRCIDSVAWQLTEQDQLLLVGDKCDPIRHLERTSIPMFSYTMKREVLSGECATRNLGLQHATGEWIKFLDADDLLAPFALNAFRAAVAKGLPEKLAVLAGSQVKVVNGIHRGFQDPPDIEAAITKVNPTLPSMCFVRRKAAAEVEGFDERIDFEGDWDFWLRLRAKGWKFGRCLIPFCYYWIDDAERVEKEKTRTHQVEGMDVRAYFAKTYGITPQ